MKILYLSYDGASDPLGQSQIIPYLEKLSQNNIDFILLTYDKPYNRSRDVFKGLSADLLRKRIKWVSLTYHKKPRILAKIYDITNGLFRCLILVKKKRITIVHGRSFVGAVLAMILKKVSGVKFVLDYRGFWPDERVDGNLWPKGGILYKISKYMERLLLINADEIVVLTYKAKAIIEKSSYNNGFKILVIPTCVDLERFKSKTQTYIPLGNRMLTLVYLGSIGTWYMLDEMIVFFKTMLDTFRSAHFLFITPMEKERIEVRMRANDIKSDNYSIRNIFYTEVPNLLSTADFSIFFIKPLFSKVSSCPTKMGEALACGLPVVINSGIGDCDEIIKENKAGVVIDEFSIEAYQRSILELRNLLNEGDELYRRCRETAEKYFSLDKGAGIYHQIYKRLNTKG